jgi:hypothetical protein
LIQKKKKIYLISLRRRKNRKNGHRNRYITGDWLLGLERENEEIERENEEIERQEAETQEEE